ncbi:hypothetical protein ACGC1H_002392 [Rhizoctonia solani]|uniref:HNH nuclease domain-containing protein n=1 Tax=Rhizoctonia solani TaxID=456999 RepID=A0A8H3CE46_9AGAM|nr:unnamed protein product [Rhizoctonia solani]
MATPLPPLGNLFQGVEDVRAAYERILPLEYQNPVLIRILGWMLIHAPNVAGQASVARSINLCSNNERIIAFGQHCFQFFIKYFKTTANKPTPATSYHPSRPSMDNLRDQILESIDQAPTSHSMAKDRALVRDGYRCQLTGRFDYNAYFGSPVVRAQADASPAAGVGTTQCHHILPQYISHHIENNEERRVTAATVWSVVTDFGGIPPQEINGDGIHNLTNIMTLRNDIHTSLDKLQLWLEPIEGTDNMYNVGRRAPIVCPEVPPTITLATDTPLPLPDRRYLALHAACAKVVLMSGAAEPIDTLLRDAENTKVLSPDGSSAPLLDSLLCGHVIERGFRSYLATM